MNEATYLAVCEECNQLLRAPESTLERMAIPWLHVIREHPIVLPRYADVARPAINLRARAQGWALSARNVVAAGWQFGVALTRGGDRPSLPAGRSERVDVLFVSYLLNSAQAGDASDFYFSSLPHRLAEDGVTSVIALINATGSPGRSFAGKWAGDSIARIVIPESTSFAGEWALFRRLRREARALAHVARRQATGLARNVARHAAREAWSSGAWRTLRLEGQIADLVAELKPRVLVVAHEGHAWERIAFAAARRADPGVLCVGYQHSSIFRLQYAIRQPLPRQYMADRIMTAGSLGKSQLETAPALETVAVEVLGSARAVRLDGPAPQARIPGRLSCLVIPEGIEIECDLLFEFSKECARVCPEVQFLWRLHPAVSFRGLMKRNPKLRMLPGNIRLSEARLDDDLAECQLALYRGTTAVVQAVGAGLRPIYLRRSGEMSIDPLAPVTAMSTWRLHVDTAAEFRDLVSTELTTPATAAAAAAAKAACAEIFSPFNPRVLSAVVGQTPVVRR